MSAPLVVNTTDGTVWTRRGAMRGGEALYALADVEDCPDLVMATLAELAEHGIAGSADVLPVPVGPAVKDERSTITALIGDAKPARDGLLVQLAESVRDRREHDHSTQREDWYCMNLTSFMGERMGSVLRRLLDAEARVAELEAERHTTNEALDDAAKALREQRDRIAELEAQREALAERLRAGQRWQRGRNPELVSENFVSQSELRSIFGIPLVAPWDEPADADGITQRIAPTQPLRGRALLDALTVERAERTHNQRLGIEDPHDGPLCHTYRVGRDLPETGGAR